MNEDRRKVEADREALEKSKQELLQKNEELRIANTELEAAKKNLDSQVEEHKTRYTKLEQDNQTLTDANTKLTAQVADRDAALADLKSNQKQLVDENAKLKEQTDAFTKVVHVLAVEKQTLQDQVTDLQKKASTALIPKLKTFHTGKDGLGSWAAVATRRGIDLEDLFRLNRDIDRNSFNWDKCVVYLDKS